MEEEAVTTTALTVREHGGAMTVDELREQMAFEAARIEETKAFVEKHMKVDVHYGKIPGTKKPTLYQPGAQIMAGIYRYAPSYAITEAYEIDRTKRWQRKKKAWNNSKKKLMDVYAEDGQAVMEDIVTTGRYEVTVTCTLTHMGSGQVVGQGVGSCNSWEKKYAPLEVDDVKNTVLKVGKKRAYVDAVLSACRLSDFFTQDVEDLVGTGIVDEDTAITDIPYTQPKPAATPQAQEQAAPDGGQDPAPPPPRQVATGAVPNPWIGKIAQVKRITGGTNDRGEWTLWGVHTSDKLIFKTFTDGPAAFCKKAQADGATVKIQWEPGQRNDMMLDRVFRA